MTTITAKSLQAAQPKQAAYFIRDDKVKGFAAKINPSGSIKLIAEVRHEGRTVRNRFYQIRDKGINGGISTYSQATKTMRILSALMQAWADYLDTLKFICSGLRTGPTL